MCYKSSDCMYEEIGYFCFQSNDNAIPWLFNGPGKDKITSMNSSQNKTILKSCLVILLAVLVCISMACLFGIATLVVSNSIQSRSIKPNSVEQYPTPTSTRFAIRGEGILSMPIWFLEDTALLSIHLLDDQASRVYNSGDPFYSKVMIDWMRI